jgi:glycine betaine/proline transport system substrate-binding protein
MVFAAGSLGFARDKLVLAQLDWASAIAAQYIMKEILENELNIPTEKKGVSVVIAWAGADRGDVDIIPEIWWPNQEASVQKYVREKETVEMKLLYGNARQGFWTPEWVYEEYGIRDIKDLNKHTDKFDLTGDKIGDIWVGAFGWYTNDINKAKIKAYNLNYEPFVVDNWVFLTNLKEAMRQRKPIIFYYWEPDWIFALYDLKLVQEPEYTPAKWKYNDENPEKSFIACEWQSAKVYTAYNKDLKKKFPKAYKFVQNFYLPIDAMYQLIADIEEAPGNPKKDPEKVAKKWIDDHPDIVADWLKGVK